MESGVLTELDTDRRFCRSSIEREDRVAALEREARMESRLMRLHEKVQWMAEPESRSAWVKGDAAQGAFLNEKERLLEDAENILDQLIQAGRVDAQRA